MLQTLRWTIFNPVFNLTPCSGWCCCQLPCGGHGSWSWSLVGLVSWFLVKSPQERERERDLRAISCTNQTICPSTITKYTKWWYITHQWQVLCFSNPSPAGAEAEAEPRLGSLENLQIFPNRCFNQQETKKKKRCTFSQFLFYPVCSTVISPDFFLVPVFFASFAASVHSYIQELPLDQWFYHVQARGRRGGTAWNLQGLEWIITWPSLFHHGLSATGPLVSSTQPQLAERRRKPHGSTQRLRERMHPVDTQKTWLETNDALCYTTLPPKTKHPPETMGTWRWNHMAMDQYLWKYHF